MLCLCIKIKILLILEMAFSLPNATIGDILKWTCQVPQGSSQPEWLVNLQNLDPVEVIPECKHACIDAPPWDLETYNITWNRTYVIGSPAIYVCQNASKVMMTRMVYNKITMICGKKQLNVNATWMWNDEGDWKTELPSCTVRPSLFKQYHFTVTSHSFQDGPECSSIQQQVFPEQPSDPSYIVDANLSHVQAPPGFKDIPAKVGTEVGLSCAFRSEG